MRGLLVQFHPANCTACDDYVEHAVNASRKHEIDCPPKDVEKAVQDAWPAYVYTIGERVRDEMRDELHDVQEKHNRLADKYDDLFVDYKKLKASKAERDDIIDQLKREIEELKAPQLSTPYPGGFNGVLDITSDEEFEAEANRPASPAAQSSSTGVSRHDKLAGKKKRAKAVAPYPKGGYRTHTVVVDPPISETGVPPRPLGKTAWFRTCSLDNEEFKSLVEKARKTKAIDRTTSMKVALSRCNGGAKDSRPEVFVVENTTSEDMKAQLREWLHNPEGLPPAIREEEDGTLNISDVDVWMWVRSMQPKNNAAQFRELLWSVFGEVGYWATAVAGKAAPILVNGDTMRASCTSTWKWTKSIHDVTRKELSTWLLAHGGVTQTRAKLILEPYARRLLSKKPYSSAALEGQRRQKAALLLKQEQQAAASDETTPKKRKGGPHRDSKIVPGSFAKSLVARIDMDAPAGHSTAVEGLDYGVPSDDITMADDDAPAASWSSVAADSSIAPTTSSMEVDDQMHEAATAALYSDVVAKGAAAITAVRSDASQSASSVPAPPPDATASS